MCLRYGVPTHFTTVPYLYTPLTKDNITYLKREIRYPPFYYLVVNETMLPTLSTLASAQSKVTQTTVQALTQILNYTSTHPDVTLQLYTSYMVIHIHSNSSYLLDAKVCSYAGGPGTAPGYHKTPPPNNSAVHTISTILDIVIFLATKSKVGTLFHNAKDGT